jgi:NADPH-dependent 2,4-dienoyl-CoA reductase/sulfur reductase-like enzyme
LHVAIIGNGVAGVSTALRLRELQPSWRITLISGESRYHYSRPALMYIFMGHMRYADTKPFEDSFWDAQRLDLVRDWVTEIDVEAKSLRLHRGEPLAYDKLLIATGSKSNKFGWQGQDLDGVQGLWGLQDLKTLYSTVERTRKAVIVGGGLIGIELAEMLHSRGVHVTFVVREKSYWDNVLPAEESDLVNRAIREAGMDLRLESELDSILDDGAGRVRGLRTKSGEEFECQFVGLTAGVSPNVDFLRESPIELGRGVLVDWSLRTSAPDVFAAGDCAELVTPEGERNVMQQVWYTGKMQAQVAAAVMAGGEATYDPGIWFNSAKFLDLEYHTYGRVNFRVPDEENIYWEHSSGRHSARLVHVGGKLIGLQTMGVRWRHEVAEPWICAGKPLTEVIDDLAQLDFDPEFTRRHTPAIQAAFREQVR